MCNTHFAKGYNNNNKMSDKPEKNFSICLKNIAGIFVSKTGFTKIHTGSNQKIVYYADKFKVF